MRDPISAVAKNRRTSIRTLTLSISVVALLLGAAAGAAADTPSTLIIEFIPEAEFNHGRGYNATTSEVLGACVEGTVETLGSTAQISTSRLEEIEDSRDLTNTLGVSASASFSYGVFSGSARAAYAQSHSVSSFSATYIAKSEVNSGTRGFSAPRLKAEFAQMDGNDPAAYARFRRVCGDYYVEAFTTGGEYLGVVTISTQSNEDKQSVEAALSGAVNTIGGSLEAHADFNTAVSSLATQHRMTVTEFRKGGSGAPLSLNAQTMLLNYEQFAGSVVGENAANYKVILKKYKTLVDYPFGRDPKFEVAMATIERLAELNHEWTVVLNDIAELKQHPLEYVGAPVLPLNTWTSEVRGYLGRIADAFNACADDYNDCADPDLDGKTPSFYSNQYPNTTWTKIPPFSRNESAQAIAVGSKTMGGWALFSTWDDASNGPKNPEGGFKPKNYAPGTGWRDNTGGLTEIAMGGDGTVWAINNQGRPFKWGGTGTLWTLHDAIFKWIAVGSAQKVWGVTAGGEVYAWTEARGWSKIEFPWLIEKVALGGDEVFAVITKSGQALAGPDIGSLTLITDRGVVDIAVAHRNDIYYIDGTGDLFRWQGEAGPFPQPLGKFTRVSASSDGAVWAMNGLGEIFKLGEL